MELYIIRQSLAGLLVGMASLMMSFSFAYTSPALPSMMQDSNFNITPEEASWIASIVPAGALLGSILSAPLVDNFGRKGLTLLFIPWNILAWIGIAVSPNALLIILARFITGICLGVNAVTASVYSSECIQVDLRGFMNLFPAVLGSIGLLLPNAGGEFLNWREIAWLGVLVSVLFLFLAIYLPETPFFLFKKGNTSKCSEILKWFYVSETNAQTEYKSLVSLTKHSGVDVSVWDLFRSPNTWPVWIAIFLHSFQQFTGINALNFYLLSIFEDSSSSISPGTSSIIINTVNIFVGLLSSALTGMYPRKHLMASSWILACSLIILSGYFYAKESLLLIYPMASYIPLVAVLSYMCSFTIGWGPIPWIFLGEGLPSQVRGLASAVAVSINWIFTFLITKTFVMLIGTLGYATLFLAYALLTILGVVIVNVYMPETFLKSASEMDNFYCNAYKTKTQ